MTAPHGTPQVLIAGAGPTGLVLALRLARHRVPFRIVDRAAGPGLASRAMVVHARTLEFYRQLGFAEETVHRGIKVQSMHLRDGTRELAAFDLGDLGAGLSPFPFLLSLPQDDHERLLGEQLAAAGHAVEWNTELAEFTEAGDAVCATLRRDGTAETVTAAYLCGCDGAHSAVRRGLGLGFPGGTYEQSFFVADVRASGPAADGGFNMCLGATAFCAVFPVRSSGMQRLIGVVPEELNGRDNLDFEDVRAHAERLVGLQVQAVNWFSTYRVHHRVAEQFRRGRVFIAGDAGHIHSPAGGQGMNTGIGDAVNLSWKLADVLAGRAAPALLDSYEAERIAFARVLVATTDRAFQGMVDRNLGGRLVRTVLVPHLLPLALGFPAVRHAAFRTVSQTRISYRDGPLAAGHAGDVRGGDRLPWVCGGQGDNFVPLAAMSWQVHVYGTPRDGLRQAVDTQGLPLHVFPWDPAAEHAGLGRDAAYLIRPDGYVAWADPDQDGAGLQRFLAGHGLTPGGIRSSMPAG